LNQFLRIQWWWWWWLAGGFLVI